MRHAANIGEDEVGAVGIHDIRRPERDGDE
jgi:hypothetical protein